MGNCIGRAVMPTRMETIRMQIERTTLALEVSTSSLVIIDNLTHINPKKHDWKKQYLIRPMVLFCEHPTLSIDRIDIQSRFSNAGPWIQTFLINAIKRKIK